MTTHKTIAKNTLFLYFRMILVMGVTLYTSRIILDQLGASDYGIYSVIGGVVALFAFLNSAMSSATQRYLAFDLGKNDPEQLQKTFSATLTIHIAIALIILLLAETVGLWYVNNKLSIPNDRYIAANVVYQFSVAAAIVQIIQVPYDALIIARERMNIYAYISILEAGLKLGGVFLLVFLEGDKLIIYAIIIFIVLLIIRLLYQIYCRRNYKESKYSFYYEKDYFNELISYSGWSLFGGVATVARGQGLNIVLNIFFGTIVNAAYGITLQVQSALVLFVRNFQKAVNPQIIKTYSKGELDKMHRLIMQNSKFSFYLMLLISVPFIVNADFILHLWLKNPPEHTIMFVQLSLIGVLIDCISFPLMIGVQSSGKIKWYQIIVGSLIIFTLPLAYIWIVLGGNPEVIYYSIIIINLLSLISRMFFVEKLIGLKPKQFVTKVLVKILIVSIATILLMFAFTHYINVNNWLLILVSGFVTISCILFLGINKQEYKMLKTFIKK